MRWFLGFIRPKKRGDDWRGALYKAGWKGPRRLRGRTKTEVRRKMRWAMHGLRYTP